jgi:hypothetical protein
MQPPGGCHDDLFFSRWVPFLLGLPAARLEPRVSTVIAVASVLVLTDCTPRAPAIFSPCLGVDGSRRLKAKESNSSRRTVVATLPAYTRSVC